MNNRKFTEVAEAVLAKYQDTPLRDRWGEAISFGTKDKAIAYWIRDSEDVVNIVWLSPDSIRDITWFPQLNQSVFNLMPLRNIASFEIREGADIAKRFGYVVEGNLLIRIFCVTNKGDIAWVSSTKQQEQNLRTFFGHVLRAYENVV